MSATIGGLLWQARQRAGRGSTLEAQLLLGRVLGRERSWVLGHPEHGLAVDQLADYRTAIERLNAGEPLPYLLGEWEFFGRRFAVGPPVLIPRPETELMVEWALSFSLPEARILDIGTGSGCVAVSLACERPGATVVGTDQSLDALRFARANAQRHGVSDRTAWVAADLASPVAGQFDLVCANLPYLPTDRLERLPVARAEPRLALDGGRTGVELIRRALHQLPRLLAPGGAALFEIDAEQASAVTRLARQSTPNTLVHAQRDLAGHPRLIVIERDGQDRQR